MESKESSPDKIQLSGSSQTALNISSWRAIQRSADPSVEMTVYDLLVGMLLSHPQNTEIMDMLDYAGLSRKTVFTELTRDGGFPPEMDASELKKYMHEDPPSVSHCTEVIDALTEAENLAREHNPEKPTLVRIRDLFGGILITENEASNLIAKNLADTPLSFDEIKKTFPEFLKQPSSGNKYITFLQNFHPIYRYSDFDADATEGDDLVGIGPDVNAMAYLIAAKSLKPPLAIGLFGDWGYGKSFFIQALKNRIDRITCDARKSSEKQENIDIFKYVVQIEFNAWHYVEGELWASLVEYIFSNLQINADEKEDVLRMRTQHWLNKLREARYEEEEVKRRREKLENELEKTHEAIKNTEKQLEESRKEIANVTVSDVWEAVNTSLNEDDKNEIKDALNKVGISEAGKSAKEMYSALNESVSIVKQGHELLAPLRLSGWRGAVWVGIILFVVAFGPLVTLVVSKIPDMPKISEAFTTLGGFVTALAAALAGANGWVRSWLNKIQQARAKLESKKMAAQSELNVQREKLNAKNTQLIKLLEKIKQEERNKQEEIREFNKELEGLTPSRVLNDFIEERVGSEDYRKHLGIPALIRTDFNRLSRLIEQENEEFEKSDEGNISVDDKCRPIDDHHINRIVLYIDDLDRCPPKRVVEVLQAVHLLLAFPLFVVVVAVDARWLAQSLESRYQDLLTMKSMEEPDNKGRKATPHDYLEKIFQIPFWIKPLSESARVRIVQGMVARSLVRRRKEIDIDKTDEGRIQYGHKIEEVVQWEKSEPDQPLKSDFKSELQPKGLQILEKELEFMEILKPILGVSPRSVKRFVNVYRLVKTSLGGGITNFLSDSNGADYKKVLFLLAVVTGLPGISQRFFQEMARLTDTMTKRRYTLQSLINKLGVKESNEDENEQLQGTANLDLARIKSWLKQNGGSEWGKMNLKELAQWTPRVARFSYRIETT